MMKLQSKIAGLSGSLAFLVTAFPGFYQQTRPSSFASIGTSSFSGFAIFETLTISLLGAIAVGMIGYVIGDILSNPKGKAKEPEHSESLRPQAAPMNPVQEDVAPAEEAMPNLLPETTDILEPPVQEPSQPAST